MDDASFGEAIRFLYGRQLFGVKLGLERMREYCALLGNPHDSFESVHVAGTNGKGSTCSFLESILRAEGVRTGLYLSPHLHGFSERIQALGTAVDAAYLTGWVAAERERIERLGLTFFEAVTALAFCWFRDRGVEVAVCEVGLGGRLDATNVLRPLSAVITGIDLDHEEHLGAGKDRVAAEKLGILKEGVPLVTGEVDPRMLELFRDGARRASSELLVFDEQVEIEIGECTIDGSRFDYRSGSRELRNLTIPVPGRHQVRNAALALFARENISPAGAGILTEPAVRSGLAGVRIPGRFEVLEISGGTVVLDVAHNPAAASMLAETCELLLPGRKAVVVIGMSSDKDAPGIIRALSAVAAGYIVTRPDFGRHERRAEAADLLETAGRCAAAAEEAPDVSTAVSRALERLGPSTYLLVTGSFYTVSEAFRALERDTGPAP